MTTEEAGTFQHRACIYEDDREYLETVVPFLAEGLAFGEPALAVTTPANLELIGAALRKRAGEVDYAESAFFGRRPPQRVAAFYRYWRTHAAARQGENGQHPAGRARVRILAEPVWAGRSAREIAAWTRMESALNVALASTSISMICPYDARSLGPDLVADAECTHPALITGERSGPSARYIDPAAFARARNADPLAEPPADATALAFDGDLRALRRFISDRAAEYGVEGDRAEMLVLAVSEVGAYLKRQPPGSASVRTWEQPGAVVCDFRQPGGSIRDPFLGMRPAELEPGDGDGLWLTNQICDWMEIRSGDDGCAIQLQVPSRHDQELVAQPAIRYTS
jgi:hypothetical protein